MSTETGERRKRVIRLLAEVLDGLQVPLSIPGSHLGAAKGPLVSLRQRDALNLFGWPDADEIEKSLTKVMNRRRKAVAIWERGEER